MFLSLAQVVLKDESDIDPNDQNSILEHLDKVVSWLLKFIVSSYILYFRLGSFSAFLCLFFFIKETCYYLCQFLTSMLCRSEIW